MLELVTSRSKPAAASDLNGFVVPGLFQSISNSAVAALLTQLLPIHMQLSLPWLLPLHIQLLLPPSPLLQLLSPSSPPITTLATVTALKSGGAIPNELTKPMLTSASPMEN